MTQHSTVTKQFYNKAVSKLNGVIRDKDRRIEYLERAIEELKQQNCEISAHNERYRVFVELFCEKVHDTPETHWIYPSVQTLKRCTRFSTAPSLNEVRREFFIEGAVWEREQSYHLDIDEEASHRYPCTPNQ